MDIDVFALMHTVHMHATLNSVTNEYRINSSRIWFVPLRGWEEANE